MAGLVPYFSYRDAAAALDWLETAFGFERTRDFRDDAGTVVHAELRLGDGRVMLGSGEPPSRDPGREDETSPRAHGVYAVVEDVDAAYASAVRRRRARRLPAGGHRVRHAPLPRARRRGLRVELRQPLA
jgi:uncharacterized glyoxalase superfamily protein PhnB